MHIANLENIEGEVKGKSPLVYFEQFFNDQVYDLIVTETTRYARGKK